MQYPFFAHAFVDGAYLRKLAKDNKKPLVDPSKLVRKIVQHPNIRSWCALNDIILARVVYYDAKPDDDLEINQELRDYWKTVELQPDTELGFGSTRGGTKKKPPRQKGVDTLIPVDMLV